MKKKFKFQAVDLGLPSGRKWASCNVGAKKSSDYGTYFDFDEANDITFTDGWRLPTKEEFIELNSNCEHFFGAHNEVIGMLFVSKINGNSIFFPASGYYSGTSLYDRGANGNYWSSSFGSSAYAYYLNFNSGGVGPASNNSRRYGFSVRAVQ